MSGKYAPIAGYPDGVYNFGPRYVTPRRAVEPSRDLAGAPSQLAIRPRGKERKNRITRCGGYTREHTREPARTPSRPPKTHHERTTDRFDPNPRP